MYKITKLVTLADASARDVLVGKLRAAGGDCILAAPTLEGSHFGGDLLVHAVFDTAQDLAAFDMAAASLLDGPAVASVDSVTYRGAGTDHSPRLQSGVYRTLLLCVDEGTGKDAVARFEAELRMMPHYIPAIRNWQLSRVDLGTGARRWTHVWEQEYADVGGLLGPYMMHPYHWARVDRWFDPECPERIVDTCLCHSFCAIV